MCDLASPDGLYGYIVRFPSDNLTLLWGVILLPLGVLLWLEIGRFLQPVTRLFQLPILRSPEASTEVQSFQWYLSQLALLWLAGSVLVFVEAPTEPAWGAYVKQAQLQVSPACASTLQDIITWHNWLNIAAIVLGIVAPIAVFFYREARAGRPYTP